MAAHRHLRPKRERAYHAAASRLCALLAAGALLLPAPSALARAAEPTPPSDTAEPPDAPDLRVVPFERSVELIEVDEQILDMIVERDERDDREEQHRHAMPVPTRGARFRDKRLRHDRGMLAAGIIVTAVCGAASGLAFYALIDGRGRVYGQDSRDAVGAFTGLLGCTAGALALAITGASRLKKRRAP